MIPKVAGMGASFKGAGLYYLHDRQADTAERIAFTHTENLPTNDPDMALKMMAHTAMRQDYLKTAAGVAATGRKLAKAVYTYSLSWSPDQAPSQAQMIEAARETLHVLGLQDHEVLMVGHSDTEHPHIHIIANRVHPETGLAAKLSKDHLKLSKWAEGYERRTGKILCEQRVENNARRAKGDFVKYERGIDAAAFHNWRKDRLKKSFDQRQSEKQTLAAAHKGQRAALYDSKEAKILAVREDIKEQNRPKWAALYQTHKAEKAELNRRNSSFGSRVFSSPEKRSLRLLSLANGHGAQRENLKADIAGQVKKAIGDINKDCKEQLRRLQNTQRIESQKLAEKHSAQSQSLARAIADNSDIRAYRDDAKTDAKADSSQPAPAGPRPRPPSLEMNLQPPLGPPHEARQKRVLFEQKQQRLEARLQEIKAENRPKWAALFKAQRDEFRAFHKARQAALPRLFYHLKHKSPRQRNPLPGAVRALLGTKHDLKALELRHENERKALARQAVRQRSEAENQADRDYNRDLARLELELAREAAAYKKAVQEGQTQARIPDHKAPPGAKIPREDFARQMRARLEQDKRREEQDRKRRGRDEGGRGRGD